MEEIVASLKLPTTQSSSFVSDSVATPRQRREQATVVNSRDTPVEMTFLCRPLISFTAA